MESSVYSTCNEMDIFSYIVVNVFHPEAVRANRLTHKASDDEVERVAKAWLKNSGDRKGGRRRREKPSQSTSTDDRSLPDDSTELSSDDGSNSELFSL